MQVLLTHQKILISILVTLCWVSYAGLASHPKGVVILLVTLRWVLAILCWASPLTVYISLQIIEIECTMDQVVSGLEDPNTNVKLAAVKCLHSLSRSVQQLRTSFQDTAVWKPIMKLLQDASDNMMTVASSALCNLLLEFSPSKEVQNHLLTPT